MFPSPTQPPRIQVLHEREHAHGWLYALVMHHPDNSVTRHEVSLSWCDHDFWSGGRVAPSATVEHVLDHLILALPDLVLPSQFDLARARRWHPEIDREVAARLGGNAA